MLHILNPIATSISDGEIGFDPERTESLPRSPVVESMHHAHPHEHVRDRSRDRPRVSEPAGQFPVIFWPRHFFHSREQHDKQRVRVRVRAMPLMGASFFDLDIGGCW
jgi:hypothetical protein